MMKEARVILKPTVRINNIIFHLIIKLLQLKTVNYAEGDGNRDIGVGVGGGGGCCDCPDTIRVQGPGLDN
jgi:hypothetical protein